MKSSTTGKSARRSSQGGRRASQSRRRSSQSGQSGQSGQRQQEDEKLLIQNIWILNSNLFDNRHNFACLRGIYQSKNPNDIVYLYGDKNKYDIGHLKYLCNITSFNINNIMFTKGIYPTLWDDILNDKDTLNKFLLIIINSYKSGKFKYLNIRCGETYIKTKKWWYSLTNNKYSKYNYLLNYIKLEMETNNWIDTFGNKSILHPIWKIFVENNYDLLNTKLETVYGVFNFENYFKIPKGFVCHTKQDIIDAYDYFVNKYKINQVLLKDCYSAAGRNIKFISNKDDILGLNWDLMKYGLVVSKQDSNNSTIINDNYNDSNEHEVKNEEILVRHMINEESQYNKFTGLTAESALNGGFTIIMEENLTKTVDKNCTFIGMNYSNFSNYDKKYKTSVYGPTLQIFQGDDTAGDDTAGDDTAVESSKEEKKDSKKDENKENDNIIWIGATMYDKDIRFNSMMQGLLTLFLSNELKPLTQGGFDFYINNNNKYDDIYLIDINTGRPTGPMSLLFFIENNKKILGKKVWHLTRLFYPKQFITNFDNNNKDSSNEENDTVVTSTTDNNSSNKYISFSKILNELISNDISFNKTTGNGVICDLFCYYSNRINVMIFGNNYDEIKEYRKKLNKILPKQENVNAWQKYVS